MNLATAIDERAHLDELSFEDLVEQYRPLLNRMAKQYIPGLEFEDRFQELTLTLWRAKELYDPTKLSPRVSYAGFLSFLMRSMFNRVNNMRTYSRRHWAPSPSPVELMKRATQHRESTGHQPSVAEFMVSCQCGFSWTDIRHFTFVGEETMMNLAEPDIETVETYGLSDEAKEVVTHVLADEKLPLVSEEVKKELRAWLQI